MKNDRSIDLGLTGYEELFMSTEERLDAKKPKVKNRRDKNRMADVHRSELFSAETNTLLTLSRCADII